MDPALNTVWSLINTGGVVAVLIFNVWMFMAGKIISGKVHNESIEAIENNTELMANKLCIKMEEAVKKGMIAAHYEINGGGPLAKL